MTPLYLLDHALLRLHGADAPDFLNRLLTIDAKRLPVGSASRAFMLDARGKIVLAVRLFRHAETEYWADMPPAHEAAVRQRLDMFHFGERFAVDALDSHRLVCVIGAEPPGGIPSGRVSPGADWDVWLPVDAPLPKGEPVDPAWCEHLRIERGVPRWPNEYRDDITPLDVGMDGVTEGKGCYPGQEVIERTLALGRPARRLVRVALERTVEPGTLLADGTPAGWLTSVSRTRGLALIKYKQTGPFERDGVRVEVIAED